MLDRKLEEERRKVKMRVNNAELMVRMLAGIISEGEDYPKLSIKSLDLKNLMEIIEEKCVDDEILCEKAINIYEKIENILKDFTKDNNIESKESEAKENLAKIFNLF